MSGEQPLKIKKISKASYNSLISEGTIAPNTIYIIINDDGLTGDLYFGDRNIVNQEHILKRIERNVPNGFVGLDENGEIDDAYLPDGSLGVFYQDIELKPIDVAEEVGEAFNSHQIILSSSILELQDEVGPEIITSSPELLSTTFAAQDLAFSEDGLSVFVIDSTTDSINQYSLLTPFDVSTLNTTPIATRSVIETNPYGLFFKPDGTSLYYIGSSNRKIYQCDLLTPWDLSTAQAEQESPLLTKGTYQSLFFSSNGSKVYILNSTTDVVQIHTLSSAWQITSLSTTMSENFSVTSQETTPTGIYISPDGLKLFLVGSSSDKVFEYNLSSAWGNSATFTGNSIAVKQNVTNGITFRPDGLIMFLVGSTAKQIDAYSIPFAFSLSTDANEKETKEMFKLKVKPVAETTDAALELTYNKDDQPSTVILKVSKDGTIKDGTNDNLVGTQLNGVQKEFVYANGEIVVNQSKRTTKLNGDEAIVKTKNVSWATLVSLRDTSNLIPGQQYRITDFVTTTVQEDTQSAGHAFDLIVVADDVDKLNENARAIQHDGDTYFANSKLEAWQVWYSLNNDTNRFAWADTVNGKGVIYRLIDEWNNDCPYDFKNIQFIRKITDGEYDPDGVDTWVYMFTWVNEDDEIEDLSLIGNSLLDDEGDIAGMFGNEMGETSAYSMGIGEGNNVFALGDNVFIASYAYEDGCFYGCYGNKFGVNCFDNTFGNDVYNNSFGNNVNNNSFGNDVYSNTFGNGVSSNTFGNGVTSNTFGNYVIGNSFGSPFNNNTVKNYVRYVSTPDTTYSSPFRYVTLENGLAGASAANRLNLEGIQAVVGYNTPIKVARGVETEIVAVWQNGIALAGLRKATPTTADWS